MSNKQAIGELLDYFRSRTPEMIELVRELVERESPSTSKQAVDALAAFLERHLLSLGMDTQIQSSEMIGNHLLARWGRGSGQILVLSHMDTVWPIGEIEKRPFTVQNDKAFGPGVLDMKGGLAQFIYALKGMRASGRNPKRTIVLLCNSDEEIGSPSSREIMERQARQSDYVLVLEPAAPNGALKTCRKGRSIYSLTVKGRAAHAGVDPGAGISAIEELAHQILKLRQLVSSYQGATVNVGTLRGGSRANVVAAEAHAEIDIRATSMRDALLIEKDILALKPVLPGAKLEVSGGIDRPPMERSPEIGQLFERARDIASELGFTLEESSSGGVSDGNITAALGVPTLDGLGPVGDGAHSTDEHLVVSSLADRTALLTELLVTL